jgi:hypothetical protein
MGEICCKKVAPQVVLKNEPEKIVKQYSSKLDKYNVEFEVNYNFFKYFQLYEYMLIVSNIKSNQGTPSGTLELPTSNTKASRSFNDEIGIGEYLSFIKNKILSNFLIQDFMNDKPDHLQLFEEFMQQMFDSLIAARFTLLKEKNKNPERKIRKKDVNSIKKVILITFGLLYCSASFKTKTEIFFNLFTNEKSCLELTDELDDFLFFLFLIPSYLTHRVVSNLAPKFPKLLTVMREEDDVNLAEFFELQDVQRIKGILYKELLGESNSITKIAFEQSFMGDKYDWIFDPRGIRYQLEIHNNNPEEQKE